MNRIIPLALVALLATPANAVDCIPGQAKEIVLDLAGTPGGIKYLPQVTRDESGALKAAVFPLRSVSERCIYGDGGGSDEPSASDFYRLKDFPGYYRSVAAVLEILDHMRQLRQLGLADPEDLAAAAKYFEQQGVNVVRGGGN